MTGLKNVLHSRADTVRTVNLADGAMARGRLLRRRRTALAAVSGIVAAGLLTSAIVQWAPPASTDPAAEPDAMTAWTALPPTLTFVEEYSYELIHVSGADDLTVSTDRLGIDPDFDDMGAWTVPPDGKQISMVDAMGLRIGPVSEGVPPHRYEAPLLCATQRWSPDLAEIMVADCSGNTVDLVFVDTATGDELRRVADVDPLGSAFYLGGGQSIGWGNNRDGYRVADLDGTNRRPLDVGTIPNDPTDAGLPPGDDSGVMTAYVNGVSADGRFACHAITAGNDEDLYGPHILTDLDGWPEAAEKAMNSASDPTDCDILMDVERNRPVVLTTGEDFLDGVLFGPNGETIIGVYGPDGYNVRLLNETFTVIDERRIPVELHYIGSEPSPLRAGR